MVEANRKHKEFQVEESLVNETRPVSQTKFNHEYYINNIALNKHKIRKNINKISNRKLNSKIQELKPKMTRSANLFIEEIRVDKSWALSTIEHNLSEESVSEVSMKSEIHLITVQLSPTKINVRFW
ncbi:unnamed protein product [Moneuplotes crassus]|uniref:Uncharacterized protein n=1 Tax=Euplotes crassus TaxID=5936 RepID=A0AAD1XC61_EUPCR|nr:unnamed protein product [Moneuplotes crassus]